MSQKKLFLALWVLSWGLVFPISGAAMTARSVSSQTLEHDLVIPVTMCLKVGLISGKSREFVFEDNDGSLEKVSELIRRLENVPVIGLGASLELPYGAKLNVAAWTKVGSPSSYMEDYDWYDVSKPQWTDFSRSATTLTHGEMYDVNLIFPVFTGEKSVLSGVLGFRHDHWRWEDHGGWYIYSSGGFRNKTGMFAEHTGITYEQRFYAPYFGLEFEHRWGDLTLSGRLAGSK